MTFGLPSASPPIQLPMRRKLAGRKPRADSQRAYKSGQDRQKYVGQIGKSVFNLVGDVKPLAPQRPRLPQEGDVPPDCGFHIVAFRGLGHSGIAQSHQPGDAAPMVDHALAPHLGRVGGEHRCNKRRVQEVRNRTLADAFGPELCQCIRQGGAGIGGHALPVLRQIGEEREEHEAANEGQSVVERERFQPAHQILLPGKTPMPVDRRGAYGFDAIEQDVAVMHPDGVAEQPSKISDVGILLDRPHVHRRVHAGLAPVRSGAGRPCSEFGSHS